MRISDRSVRFAVFHVFFASVCKATKKKSEGQLQNHFAQDGSNQNPTWDLFKNRNEQGYLEM